MVSKMRLTHVMERRLECAKRRGDSTRSKKLKAMLHCLRNGERPGLVLLELQSVHKVSRDIPSPMVHGKGRTPWIAPVPKPKRYAKELRGGL
jgi:hypothetical protein